MLSHHKPLVRTLALLWIAVVATPGRAPGQALPPKAPGETPSDEPSLPTAADRPEEMDAFLARLLATSTPSSPEPVASEPALPATPTDLEREAFETFRDSGDAPIVATPDGLLHPYGHGIPTLICIPDRACDIALEAGEVIDGLAVGDPEGWQTTFLTEGEAPEPIPHILLQPTGADLKTNLVVVTSRRTYHVELTSPPEDELEGDDTVYHHLRWWYPDRWTQKLRGELGADPAPEPEAEATSSPEADRQAPAEALETAVELGDLDFGYRVKLPRRRSRRLPWEPTSVFDDGRNVYLHLPPVARATDLPVVLGRAPDGSTFPVNAHVQGSWIILPALFEELELVTGSGDERRFLRIHHTGQSR